MYASALCLTPRVPWQYTYLQLGCSAAAEQRMLKYARRSVGKPFSNYGMARSLIWPRHTDASSFFCAGAHSRFLGVCVPLRTLPRAELVAAILKEGGLMDPLSNPGSATPETLYRIYKERAAVAANPYVLRDVQARNNHLQFGATIGTDESECESLLLQQQQRAILAPMAPPSSDRMRMTERGRSDSPPRSHFRNITPVRAATGGCASGCTISCNGLGSTRATPRVAPVAAAGPGLTLTLTSLDMSRRGANS